VPLPLEEEQAGPTGEKRRERLLYGPRGEWPWGRQQAVDAIPPHGVERRRRRHGTKTAPKINQCRGVVLIDGGVEERGGRGS